ncbi:MAG: nucleotidyltransferase [Saprospiraceae bacterium]|nr:nucleotidyltransferase [Saprospiraceae bacterium]MCB0543861.1 nucleotidyltransferase [Saprospiraceae bacterium]
MKPTLLILAAGIGSRYGGLKQVDGMGPGGESILEFSAFDALRAGFGKVVFVIRRDIEAAFREKVGSKVEPHIRTEYAFQEMDTALDWLDEKPHREKPWGTGHAILSAKQHLTEPFVAINADDFYGAEAFRKIGDFLRHDCTPSQYGMVAYRLGNTLSENGAVSRGVCSVSAEGFLTDVTERTRIERFAQGPAPDDAAGIAYTDDAGRHPLPATTPVSMNFWGFHPTVLAEIESQFRAFVQANIGNPRAEFYIPTVVNTLVEAGKVRVKVLNSDSQWYGVTYTEDKETVQAALASMVERGLYPKGLWRMVPVEA